MQDSRPKAAARTAALGRSISGIRRPVKKLKTGDLSLIEALFGGSPRKPMIQFPLHSRITGQQHPPNLVRPDLSKNLASPRMPMSRTSTHSLRVLLLSICLTASGLAQSPGSDSSTTNAVPTMVRFSGVVKGEAGHSVGLTFALYKDQQGGAPLWLETQSVAVDADGHYTVQLGATAPHGLPKELFASGEARWLGVQLEGQVEHPRVLLLSVPYALKAADAETLGGRPLSAFVLATPSIVSPASGTSDAGTPARHRNDRQNRHQHRNSDCNARREGWRNHPRSAELTRVRKCNRNSRKDFLSIELCGVGVQQWDWDCGESDVPVAG
jgi:hypothetical protein